MNGNLTFAAYEYVIPALTIWREARGEPYDAMCGVAAVIRNRVRDHRWPGSPAAVCLQRSQFSAFNRGDPNSTKFPLYIMDGDWQAWQECCRAWERAWESGVDITKGANHYHSKMPKPPKWAKPTAFTVQLGNLSFYRL